MLLNEFQENFKTLMLGSKQSLSQAPQDFLDHLEGDSTALTDRLGVYHNNIMGSLSDALIATFPTLLALTGENFLRSAARAFIMKNPPQRGCLQTYGQEFDVFIAQLPSADKFPYLADVARFELLVNDSYYAPDDAPLAPADLAAVPEEHLDSTSLSLRTSARLFESHYPIQEIYNYCKHQNKAPLPDMNDLRPRYTLILRPFLDVLVLSLSEDEYAFLSATKESKTLGYSLIGCIEKYPDFNCAAFLQKNLTLGTFAKNQT